MQRFPGLLNLWVAYYRAAQHDHLQQVLAFLGTLEGTVLASAILGCTSVWRICLEGIATYHRDVPPRGCTKRTRTRSRGCAAEAFACVEPDCLKTYGVPCPVVETYQYDHVGTMATIHVAGEVVRATGGHPCWVVRGAELSQRPSPLRIDAYVREGSQEGRWVLARDLRAGDEVLLREAATTAIGSVQLDEVVETVYNFHVEGLQNYAIGDGGVLVHNTNDPPALSGSTADFEMWASPGSNKGIIANLDKNGIVEFKINTQGTAVRGTDLFRQMMSHFGDHAKGVWGKWVRGTNLDKVNELTARGVSLEDAITQTWTANRAREAGFGRATLKKEVGKPGEYTDLEVEFTR